MAATLRELRGRIRSAGSIKKITKAQEMIATSRIAKAQARVQAARPYDRRDHQHAHRARECQRAGSSAARRARQSPSEPPCSWCPRIAGSAARTTPTCSGSPRNSSRCCVTEGKEPVLYAVGRKALSYYSFRNWDVQDSWTGFSEQPDLRRTRRRSRSTLVDAFMPGVDDEGDDPGADDILGVDELHIVFTEFKSMMSQSAAARRIAPMVVEYVERRGQTDRGRCSRSSRTPRTLFDALLPRYVATRVYSPRCSRRRRRSRRRAAAR